MKKQNEDIIYNKKWTHEELFKHIKINSDYGSAVVISALYKKLYGDYPKIGLSGYQAGAIDLLFDVLPEAG